MEDSVEKKKIQQLKSYYQLVLPVNQIFKWLSYAEKFRICYREFSFVTVRSEFSRYESFNNAKDFRNRLINLGPARIDVGPTWPKSPLWSSKQGSDPVRKELVFDIDLTDYDDVRICCQEKSICVKCWKYMVIACKIIHRSLVEDWGYKHTLWVFSGRRGIHAWVCEPSVLKFDDDERYMISEFFQVSLTNSFGESQFRLTEITSFIKHALDIIDEDFLRFCVVEMDMLGTDERVQQFINLLRCPKIMRGVKKEFLDHDNSIDRWNAFLEYFYTRLVKGEIPEDCRYLVEELKLQYCYPRIDGSVTEGINHLLKMPFSVHPATDKISVPFDPEKIEFFDPTTVPTLTQILSEVAEFKSSKQPGQRWNQWNPLYLYKTSLRDSFKVFIKFLVNLHVELR
ncbi:DNA primase small subunit-like [Cotesia glomerata]|uniref:DNA primase small subunit-like n=1 Tax=Cotesia glomerata TaxID=32391 RepID=UPI001D01F800|nr:DNA primase small subunit-like [Cotesia glomerata]